ncbi:hypothetical protein T492DRAFT_1152668 [Pavlovales sp. CCMP2436]|nr:hypothetical protein T492DRAFT_1152668 [Pavlovales sp. CCMP2436]
MARLLGRLLASGRGLQLRAGRQALGRATARYLLSSTQYPVLEHCASIVKGDQAGRVTGDPSAYTLQVYTGDRRSASTKAQVRARLIGTDGTAGPFTLTGDFYRATLQSFFVETPTPIGRLLHVEIGHDATDIGSGWFVDKASLFLLLLFLLEYSIRGRSIINITAVVDVVVGSSSGSSSCEISPSLLLLCLLPSSG